LSIACCHDTLRCLYVLSCHRASCHTLQLLTDLVFQHNIYEGLVSRRARGTPNGFRFTVKFPKTITHGKRLGDVSLDLDYFNKSMAPLQNKQLCLLLQLPPSMTKKQGLKKLEALPLDKRFRYALEVRHQSWFDDEVFSFLKENEICMAWSQLAEIQTPPVATTDFIYLRFIGDRSIPEEEFRRIQKDRTEEMRHWAATITKVSRDDKKPQSAFVPANNHYAGFGPATANAFRKMLPLPEVVWEEKKQQSITDF
jgi:uncharacterized protein YecE (DUF72 family)